MYFAKYLPIEGEIKEGDMVKTMGELIQPFKEGMNKRAYQLYKIFLCSRDIQVGETNVYPSMEAYEKGYSFLATKNNITDFRTRGFKVIGEISLQATWIKEGMEFVENDIKRDILTSYYDPESEETEYNHHHPKGNEKFILDNEDKFIIEYPIKIKCPTCKTFH